MPTLEEFTRKIELIGQAARRCPSDKMACIWMTHRQRLIEKYPTFYRQYVVSHFTPEFHSNTRY